MALILFRRRGPASGMGRVDQTHLKALHGKSQSCAEGNGINAIGVAVEVISVTVYGSKIPRFETTSCYGFILRTVYKTFTPL